MLIEEEQAAQQAQALAAQQGMENGAAQAQAINAWASGLGPQAMGGINFSSFAAFIGSVIGAFIAAAIVTTIQVIMGKDFSSDNGGRSIGGENRASVYVPEVIIT